MIKKKLPISEPLLCAYPEVGQAFSIIDYNDPKSLDWMFSNFIQLYVHHKRRLTYTESLPLHYTAGHKIPTLFHYCISKKIIEKKYGSLLRFVTESLNDEYYVSMILDRFYLSNSSDYQKLHKYHNTLIYGYDINRKIFFGKDNEGKYINKEYSFEELESAYYRGYHCNDGGENAFGSVMLVERIKNVLYEFNINYLIKELEFYLSSYNSEISNKYNVVKHYRAQLPRVEVKDFNFGVYDYFKKMLQEPDSVGGIDMIACAVFLEHKFYMKKRVEYFITKRKVLCSTSFLYEEAEKIEKKAQVFLNSLLKYVEIQQIKEVREKVFLLINTLSILDELKILEANFISNFLEELKNYETNKIVDKNRM